MTEIVIAHPELNTTWEQYYRRFSYTDRDRKEFRQNLSRAGISPITHPVAADLCAGDGTYAKMLVDNGWDARKITCIDVYQSPTPWLPDTSWKYWNLAQLHLALVEGRELPEEVKVLKGSFDLVVLQRISGLIEGKAIGKFLLRPEGYLYQRDWVYTAEGLETSF